MIHHLPISTQAQNRTEIIFTGDVILDVPEPDYWLAEIAPALKKADIAIGHLEVPHTTRHYEMAGDVPAPGADPANLSALNRAGFTAMTLAGNHIADRGQDGISDTISGLTAQGIAYCGAGENLAAARRPAMLHTAGRVVALLSYNCVGPEQAWAGVNSAGCAYLPVATVDGSPVSPPKQLTQPTLEALAILREDIARVREQAALVIVALHKGIVHTPAVVAPYERTLAHAAINAGADIVISHHAHIVRGIEFYRGKPIYHGLGNGCVVTNALSPNQEHPLRAQWALRRKQLFGFEPDPDYSLAPFHPEAVNAFLARVIWHANGEIETGIVPVHIDAPGRPRLANADETIRICNYLQKISRQADLGERQLSVQSDMVLVA